MKKGVLRNLTKFTGKHLCQRPEPGRLLLLLVVTFIAKSIVKFTGGITSRYILPVKFLLAKINTPILKEPMLFPML